MHDQSFVAHKACAADGKATIQINIRPLVTNFGPQRAREVIEGELASTVDMVLDKLFTERVSQSPGTDHHGLS